MAPELERLALGTAQLGLDYGIANRSGRLSDGEARCILDNARAQGVRTVDTAVGYGDAEARLGAIGVGGWEVITKLPSTTTASGNPTDWVAGEVGASLQRLGVEHLHAVLLHRPLELLEAQGAELYASLQAIKASGRARKIGLSIYTAQELEQILPRYPVDLVQLPLNLLDRRLLTNGWIHRLADAGVEVHARSVFLQGLLLMHREARPGWTRSWQTVWDQWDRWLDESGENAVNTALGFVRRIPEVHRIIVGVDSRDQWAAIADGFRRPPPGNPEIDVTDAGLLDPSQWPPR